MRLYAIPLAALAVLVAGCTAPDAATRGSKPSALTTELTQVPGQSRYALAQPISVSNVTIVPVITREKQDLGPEYVTLTEAKKNDWIEIVEKPGRAEVPELMVRNIGPRPILLLGGDLLLGGKQDRVVSKDTIVPPGETVEVPVYCVEPGRWSGDSDRFRYGDTSVPLSVKEQAAFGDQQQVWSEVGKFNAKAGAGGGRTTLQAGLDSKEVQDKIKSSLEEVRAKLDENENIVGVLFAVDGQVRSLELFGNHRLFKASRDTLLKGALAEAAVSKDGGASVSLADAAKFMSEAMSSNRAVESRGAGGSVNARRASPAAKGVELHFEDKDGGSSGLVHGTYRKQ